MHKLLARCIAGMLSRFKRLHLAKCGFLILLVTSIGLALSLLILSEKVEQIDLPCEDDWFGAHMPMPKFSEDILDENFDICLFSPLVLGEDNLRNTSLKSLFTDFNSLNSSRISAKKAKYDSFFKVLLRFSDLMSIILEVDTVMIEPSILFCMLSPQQKEVLIRRKFILDKFPNSPRVLTFGMREEHVPVLEKEYSQKKIRAYGFRTEFIKVPVLDWLKVRNATSNDSSSFTSHVFFYSDHWIIHLVVFYKRENFLWHAALGSETVQNISITDTYFTESDSAYENFSYVSLAFREAHLASVHIPSNPQYFLFELATSKFQECNSTVASSFRNSNLTGMPGRHSSLSVDSFDRRAAFSLQELKAIFNPLLLRFWIWSGTMLGWYRQCDVIPYTSDVDYGAWASEVDDLEKLLKLIGRSEHLKLRERMGITEKALEFNTNCHGLRVDVFFLYEESNGTWYAGHRPSKGYYFKYHHPNFSLCSAELLAQKVLVPCNTEEVIRFEYGPNWMKPVSSWNYESSIYNRGPNIYWEKSKLKEVYPNSY